MSAAEAVGRALGQTTAAITGRLPWSGTSDGLDMLERDHRQLQALLNQAADTRARGDRRAILDAITADLMTHEAIEENVLYPTLKSYAAARDIVLEGYEEHHVANVVLEELRALSPTDERWEPMLKVLKENIDHHIEEEEGDMFKTARAILDRRQLEAIGAKMQAMKEKKQAKRR